MTKSKAWPAYTANGTTAVDRILLFDELGGGLRVRRKGDTVLFSRYSADFWERQIQWWEDGR